MSNDPRGGATGATSGSSGAGSGDVDGRPPAGDAESTPDAADDRDAPTGTGVADDRRLLVLVEREGNASVLGEWLGRHPRYVAVEGTARTLREGPFDLCLVDPPALVKHWRDIATRRADEEPVPLPCLLLAQEHYVRQFYGDRSEGSDGPRSVVDDVVTTPTDAAHLDNRVGTLLRVRDQTLELERRREHLSLLNDVVGHDVANAATVVSGWGAQLREHVAPEGEHILDRVISGGDRVSELAVKSRDMVAALDEDRAVRADPMDLIPVLDAEVRAVERTLGVDAGRVEIEADSLPDRLSVLGNGTLSSVFGNLLSNAVRHSEGDLHVWVDVDDADDEEVVVRVADDGPGVPDEEKRRVFDRGRKNESSPGQGVGLYMVEQFVTAVDGRIWFEDRPGGGAVACVALKRPPNGRD